MPAQERLERRLRAVERALTGDDHDLDTLARSGDFARRLDEVEHQLDEIETRLDELDAATQAVRGYVGNVRSVNEDVAQRADAALAAVDRIENRLDANEQSHRSTTAGREQPVSSRTRRPPSTGDDHAPPGADRRQHDSSRSSVDEQTADGQAVDEERAGDVEVEREHDTEGSESSEDGVLDRIRTRL